MIEDLFNHTATVQKETVGHDALKGILPQYADLYADVPGRFDDLNQAQQELLLQRQIIAQHWFKCQLPGPIDENRFGLVFNGQFYRGAFAQTRLTMGGIPTFDLLYVTKVVP